MKERLNEELRAAMLARDTVRRDTIRLLLTTLQNSEIERGRPLTESECGALFQKQAKQRRDSITAYEQAGREDLAAAERAELAIIEDYLPTQMEEEELLQIVREAITQSGAGGPADMGRVMGPLMARLRGRADGAVVNRIVREELGGR